MSEDAERLRLLVEITRQVSARRTLDDVLATTLETLRRNLVFGGGSIQLLDDEGWIRLAATDPPAPQHVMDMRIPLGASVGGRILLTERPVYVPDVMAEESVPTHRKQRGSNLSQGGVRSYYGVPLLADGQAIGLLQVDSPEPDSFSDADRLLLVCIAPVVAAAIQSARAHTLRTRTAAQLAAIRALVSAETAAIVQVIEVDGGQRDTAVSRLRELADRVTALASDDPDHDGNGQSYPAAAPA